jgi:hypothetical protein
MIVVLSVAKITLFFGIKLSLTFIFRKRLPEDTFAS